MKIVTGSTIPGETITAVIGAVEQRLGFRQSPFQALRAGLHWLRSGRLPEAYSAVDEARRRAFEGLETSARTRGGTAIVDLQEIHCSTGLFTREIILRGRIVTTCDDDSSCPSHVE